MTPSNNKAPDEPRVFASGPHPTQGQFLLEVYPDGTHMVAWRGTSWETWTPAVEVKAVPVHKAVSA